jgi:hypothetical protein
MSRRLSAAFGIAIVAVVMLTAGVCRAQVAPGNYSCGFDSAGYTPTDSQESVNVSGIFSLAIIGSSVTQSAATLSVSDGGAGTAVCTYASGNGSIANDPSLAGYDTATLTYEPSNTNSPLCPPGNATLTLTPVNDGINFAYTNAAGFIGNGTCGPAGAPIVSTFACRYMINNQKSVGSGAGETGVAIVPPLTDPVSGQRQVAGLTLDVYQQKTQCPYLLSGTAVYPVALDEPTQGEWQIGGPTLPGCPVVPPMGEVNFTTTKDTILVTSPQVSSVVCVATVPIGDLRASPEQIDFEKQKVGSTTKRPITVTNVGLGPVTITGVTSSKPSVFGESDNCKGVLQPRGSCTVTATFTPAAKVKVEGSLTIHNNGDTVVITLVGKGI